MNFLCKRIRGVGKNYSSSVSLACSIRSAASFSLAEMSRKAFTKIVISAGLNWAGLPLTS